MEYRQLGSAGVRVSVLGLGTNRFGSKDVPQSEVDRIIDAALDAGVNFIDTANVYNEGRSEETLGHALKGRMDKVVLATKFSFSRKQGPNTWGASRYQLMQAVDQSLRRLQTDHIDVYYAHRWDDTTPIATSARRATPRGNWPMPTCLRSSKAGRRLSRFSRNTICSGATWSARFCLIAVLTALALFLTSRSPAAFSPASMSKGNRRHRVPAARMRSMSAIS